MKREELRELMQCCRPDLSDLSEEAARALAEALEQDAQLRHEWESLQEWDLAIERGLQDVDVPPGLADRLVAATQAEAPRPAPAPYAFIRSPLAARLVAAGALAATVLIAVYLIGPWSDRLTATQLADASRSWIAQLDQEAWRGSAAPTAEFPWDPGVNLSVVGWQPCSQLTHPPGGQSVVYRAMLPPARTTAYLFVIHTSNGRQLPTVPPTVPDSTTGNICVGVWKSGDYVYVLVVPGTQHQYLQALRTSAVA